MVQAHHERLREEQGAGAGRQGSGPAHTVEWTGGICSFHRSKWSGEAWVPAVRLLDSCSQCGQLGEKGSDGSVSIFRRWSRQALLSLALQSVCCYITNHPQSWVAENDHSSAQESAGLGRLYSTPWDIRGVPGSSCPSRTCWPHAGRYVQMVLSLRGTCKPGPSLHWISEGVP